MIVTQAAAARPARQVTDAPRQDIATLSLGPLAEVLGYHLALASVATSAGFERHVGRAFDLRKVEFSLLMLLLANGTVVPKRLTPALSITAPKLTMLLDRLHARGLLRRERNPNDGRSQHIVLTPAGLRLARACAAAAAPMEQDLTDRLSRAERVLLLKLLAKLGGGGG